VPRFLSGFVIKHAPAFDEWVAGKRQQLLRRHQEAMLTVARDAMARWRWHDAAVLADRILDTDPLSDDGPHTRHGPAIGRRRAHGGRGMVHEW